MGLFDKFKKKDKTYPDFSEIDSLEKAVRLAETKELAPLYMMPLRFSGEESVRNRLYVPPVAAALKDRYDDMVEELLLQAKVNGYSCSPEYKGGSFVPSKLIITASQEGKDVFKQTINIW